MDTKKLIGAILGVIAFGALIAGVTYAWLSTAVTVTSGTGVYNVGSMHFLVDYTKGQNITDVPLLSSPTAGTARVLTVRAGLAENSTPGTLTIYLNTDASSDNSLFANGGYIKYSYCIDTCSGNDFTTHTKTITSKNQIAVISETPLEATAHNYNIYFWIDDTKDLTSVANKTYSGNITARGAQIAPNN